MARSQFSGTERLGFSVVLPGVRGAAR